MTDGMGWVHSLNYREHKWLEDAMTETSAATEERLPDDLFAAASDALYGARNAGRLMDAAAADVVRAVRPLIAAAVLRDLAEQLDEGGHRAAAVFVGRMATEAQR